MGFGGELTAWHEIKCVKSVEEHTAYVCGWRRDLKWICAQKEAKEKPILGLRYGNFVATSYDHEENELRRRDLQGD